MRKVVWFPCIVAMSVSWMLSGCGGGGNPVTTATNSNPIVATETMTETITAKDGGTIRFSDGTELDIPAGALKSDAQITVTKPKQGEDLGGGFAGYVEIDPDSVSLQKKVSVTFSYDESKLAEESTIRVLSLSPNSTPTDLGSEVSYFENVDIVSQDTVKNTVTVQVDHFSILALLWEERGYLVFDLPGKYLKKGDLIYALTGATNSTSCDGKVVGCWFPGHVGLYLGTTDATSKRNDGSTIIESTQTGTFAGVPTGSVKTDTLSNFKSLQGTHIFMGARRPTSVKLISSSRKQIAQYALSQLGTSYMSIGGGPFLNLGIGGISCVGLSELSYEAAGMDIVPESKEALLYPIRQFTRTKQVDEIEVMAGEEVNFVLYGVVRESLLSFSYTVDQSKEPYTIAAVATPDIFTNSNATLSEIVGGYRFKWTPSKNDSGKSIKITFFLRRPKWPAVAEDLTIKVIDSYLPLVNGASYTYNVSSSTSGSQTTQTYTLIRTVEVGVQTKLKEAIPGDATEEILVGENGGFWVQTEDFVDGTKVATFSPGAKLIPVDLKEPDDSWNNNYDINFTDKVEGGPFTAKVTATDTVGIDFETVQVAAGTFKNVLKITRSLSWSIPDLKGVDVQGNPITIRTDERTTTQSEYYAPGVGLIKMTQLEKETLTAISNSGATDTQTTTETTNRELSAFTIP